MNIFSSQNYKDILRQALSEKKELVSKSFTFEKMAQACGIQKTYLSRVLNGDQSHLNESQLYQACSYLGMNRHERDYLQLLLLRERCYASGMKAELSQEIESLQNAHRKTDRHIGVQPTEPSSNALSQYYLDPQVMLVHVFLTVERFRRDLPHLGKVLKLEEAQLNHILTTLEQAGLVVLTTEGYRVLTSKTHLPSDAPLYKTFRSMQRLKAMERLSQLGTDKAYSFSVAFSTNPAVRQQIHDRILALIGEIERLVSSSPEEEIYQLNIDLFDWS